MTSRCLKIGLALTVAVQLVDVSNAQTAETSSRTALIIGIGVYERPEIPALLGVKEDIRSALSIATGMGIPEKNVKVLRDQQASKAGILQAIRDLGESMSAPIEY